MRGESKERVVPCILDPRRDCPPDCQLRPIAKEAFEKAVRRLGIPPGLELAILQRRNIYDFTAVRQENAKTLRRTRMIGLCEWYPGADITQGRASKLR